MKKNKKDIEWLIANCDYESLSKEDKELVAAEMSREEYISLRSVALKSKELLKRDEIEVSNKSFELLSEQFDRLSESNSRAKILGFLNYRIPAYAAAIALILIYPVLYFLAPFPANENIVYMKPDTVYQEKIVYKYQDIDQDRADITNEAATNIIPAVRKAIKKETQRTEAIQTRPTMEKIPEIYSANAMNNLILAHRQSKGSSMSKDSLIGKMLVAAH